MGLSKKLTPTIQRSESIANVDFQWSTQSYTLREIISKFKLPCVVQCSADSCSVLWSKFHFDLKQPLLLYTVRSVSKIYARTVRPDKTQSEYIEFGPPLVIPEDYEGWFGIVNSESDALPRHTNVEQVAESDGDYFLAATRVPAFIMSSVESSGVLEHHYLKPGDVLRKDGFVNGPLDAPSHNHFAAKDKHHLRCTDSKEEEYIIPFSHRGLFYDVNKDINSEAPGVVNTTQLMETGGSIFPLTLRHIQGDLPALNYSFTGTIQCDHIFSEQTILACSIDAESPIPLELECKSKIRFSIALNEVDFKVTSEYTRAFDFCSNRSEKYAKAIKISFTLKPEMSTLDGLDFSLYDNGSDIEDVDAQSEFDFDWGPENGESKEALEALVQSKKKSASNLSDVATPDDDSVDMGSPYELEQDSDKIVIKKAAAYTASTESQDSVLDQDVTVDSSLFEDSIDVNEVSVENKNGTFENSISMAEDESTVENSIMLKDDGNTTDSDCDTSQRASNQDNINIEYIGNLSKATFPGRLLKDEITRTSSGVDEKGSTNSLFEDWGPVIPTRQKIKPVKNKNETLVLNRAAPRIIDAANKEINDIEKGMNANGNSDYDEVDSDTDTMCSDINDKCIVDVDKDVSGRLTSYRSLSSLDKIDDEGAELDLLVCASGDIISLSDEDGSVLGNKHLNRSFSSDNDFVDNDGTNSSVSESAFILPNGYIQNSASTDSVTEIEENSDSSEVLEDFREILELDYDDGRCKNESVLKRKPVVKIRHGMKKQALVMDMSLEEAAV
ncbi:uncharacterized protein LOC126819213 [Patella vulgata]|uniref:uncharacterized protein LOC126819213 n=1 Tax=Patella vulgata TaxID=6465 RepID=UPI00218011A7|nr:uncharacterized protein LOC126819213 [Patella vulgata]